MTLTDARGVTIDPGDTVLWGYPVDGSIHMAEGIVVAGERHCLYNAAECTNEDCQNDTVSLTPSGRVRIRVVRRSWGGGTKPVVDVAPDRIVVLKPCCGGTNTRLPLSPLPTQEEPR